MSEINEKEITGFLEGEKHVPATLLPAGWYWQQFDDGSGSLQSPKGESYFAYDVCTVPGGIEYKETSKSKWDAWYCGFAEFKLRAETIVENQLLN